MGARCNCCANFDKSTAAGLRRQRVKLGRQLSAGVGNFLPVAGLSGCRMQFLEQIARYFDPLSFLIVFGGSILMAAARSTRTDIAQALGALKILGSADPQADAQAARVAVNRIAAIVDTHSITCADRVETAERFLHRAARKLSDTKAPIEFSRWAQQEIAGRRNRHQGAIGFWRVMADTAPAMGMIGTIIGLVQMFAAMDDPAGIGPGMALALLTTLYGVVLSSTIAGPIANRLERLSEAELAWQEAALGQFEQLAQAELEHHPARPPRQTLRTVS